MKRDILFIILCIILISVTGCGIGKSAKEKGDVLAEIGEEVITKHEFNERLEKLPENIRFIAETKRRPTSRISLWRPSFIMRRLRRDWTRTVRCSFFSKRQEREYL